MDVRVISTFLELARVRHFGRAAENLHITQAAVSARIKQLESYFGAELFTRDRNNIKLTQSGEKLISYAEVMVTTLQQAKHELSMDSNKTQQINIAGTPNIWDVYLQACLSAITDSFGGYGFNAEVLSRDQINRGLLDRTLDMAFTLDPVKSDDLESKRVTHLTLLLVSSFQEKIIDSPPKARYVYVDWGSHFAAEHMKSEMINSSPFLRTSTGRIALDFILEKGGTAYLPETMVHGHIQANKLVVVKNSNPIHQPVFLSYRKKSNALDAISAIEQLIQGEIFIR